MANSNAKTVSLIDLSAKYPDRDSCLDLLEKMRWPDGPVCPRCQCGKTYPIESRRLHECHQCRYQFSATTGTVMHRSHVPLTKWIIAAALLCNGRKGVSACQLARDLRLTYKTAWYLGHRIRRAMRDHAWLEKFSGVCEIDESYIGGRRRGKRGRGAAGKTAVVGIVERGGKVRMTAVPNVTHHTIKAVVHQYIDTNAEMVMADGLNSYNQLASEFTMGRIDHTREYVRGQIHTNTIESVWAIVKRQVGGTHHKVSRQYLPLYLGEIAYRYNNRENPDLFMSVLRNGLLTDQQLLASGIQCGHAA